MSCHDYDNVMTVLFTPIQIKCYLLCLLENNNHQYLCRLNFCDFVQMYCIPCATYCSKMSFIPACLTLCISCLAVFPLMFLFTATPATLSLYQVIWLLLPFLFPLFILGIVGDHVCFDVPHYVTVEYSLLFLYCFTLSDFLYGFSKCQVGVHL